MFKPLSHFFSRLDEKIRHGLSHHPIVYAIIGGFGIVMFWSGVEGLLRGFDFMTPVVSIVLSVFIMLATGTLVSFFVGEQVLLSGLTEEKRIDQKTEDEIRAEDARLKRVISEIDEIRRIVSEIEDIKKSVSEIKQNIHHQKK